MQFSMRRAIAVALSAAIASAVLVVMPSIAACYWQNTGGDNWTLIVDSTGECTIGAPPSSSGSSSPTPTPSATSTREPVSEPTNEPSSQPTATPSPTPTTEPEAPTTSIIDENPWLKSETATVPVEETKIVRTISINATGGALDAIVITTDDASASNVCAAATVCKLEIPDGKKYSWVVSNPTHFTVGGVTAEAAAGNTYVAIGTGSAKADQTVNVAVSAGASAMRPVNLQVWTGVQGWNSDSATGATINIDSLSKVVTLPAMLGPSKAKATLTGLPDGLVFDAATGAVTGKPTKAGVFEATLTIDYLSVPLKFAVSTGTFTLRIRMNNVAVSVGVSSNGTYLRCTSGTCETQVPLGGPSNGLVTVDAYSYTTPFSIAESSTSTALQITRKTSPMLSIDYDEWIMKDAFNVTAAAGSSATEADVVTVDVGRAGPDGAPYVLEWQTADAPVRRVNPGELYGDPDGDLRVTVGTVAKLAFIPHPNLPANSGFKRCENAGFLDNKISVVPSAMSITLNRVDRYAWVFCDFQFGAMNGFANYFFDIVPKQPQPLPSIVPSVLHDDETVTVKFAEQGTLFSGWDMATLALRVPSYHISLLASKDAVNYWEVLYADPPISKTGLQFSNLPLGYYKLKVSFNDTLLGRTVPATMWFSVITLNPDATWLGATGEYAAFSATKLTVL